MVGKDEHGWTGKGKIIVSRTQEDRKREKLRKIKDKEQKEKEQMVRGTGRMER